VGLEKAEKTGGQFNHRDLDFKGNWEATRDEAVPIPYPAGRRVAYPEERDPWKNIIEELGEGGFEVHSFFQCVIPLEKLRTLIDISNSTSKTTT